MNSNLIPILHIQKVDTIAGSENHLLDLLPRLLEHGYLPTMLALTPRGADARAFTSRMTAAGISTQVLTIRGHVDPALALQVGAFIRRGSYRIVHTHLIHADLYGVLATYFAPVPTLISSRHNDDKFRSLMPVRLFNRWLTDRADCVICISRNVQRFVEQVEFTPRTKTALVYYGLSDRERQYHGELRREMGWSERTPVVGIVARLTEQKGHTTLLDAMTTVQRQIPDVQCVVIGDGELRVALQRQAERLNLTSHTHFLGYRCDARALMSDFNLFVHPSRWEGFGLVFLEAMAASLPIVATQAGSIPEIVVDGETGLLVPPDDAASLAKAMVALLSDEERARVMGEAGHQRLLQQFTVEAMAKATADIYGCLLQ